MKYFKHLAILSCVFALLYGCQKEYSIENGQNSSSTSGQWEFKENGQLYSGPIDSAVIDTSNLPLKVLIIAGTSTDKKDIFALEISALNDITAGNYVSPASFMQYIRNGSTILYQTINTADPFSVTITSIDADGVSGTFSGTARDGSGSVTKAIVDGKFTAKFKKSNTNTPPPTDSGQAMLWSKSGCGGGTSTTPINVSISNKTGQITGFSATEPTSCGAAGAFTVKLPVGTYSWKAKCGTTDSVSGNITVTKNGCAKAEVNFAAPTGDYFPTTALSNWSYLYEASTPYDTLYTVSTGTTKSFGGPSYSIFTNTDGVNTDSSFYRKDGNGLYYEYYPAYLNVFQFDNPTPVEYIFLKDNVPAGTIWETTYTGTIAASPLITGGKIQGTILEKAASATVGTTTYQDVIKVRISYVFLGSGGLSQEIYRVEQWFARGKGLIRFIDYSNSPFTSPSDVLDVTKMHVN